MIIYYLILMPIDFLNACISASVLLISREKISLPAIAVNGVSDPSDCAIPEKITTTKYLYIIKKTCRELRSKIPTVIFYHNIIHRRSKIMEIKIKKAAQKFWL